MTSHLHRRSISSELNLKNLIMENPTLSAILGIIFWFASGYFLAYMRVKIWEDILIKKRMAAQIEFKNWNQKDLLRIALVFPWQTFRWRVSKFNVYGWEEIVPIVPISFFISIINRSNIVNALLQKKDHYRRYVFLQAHQHSFNALDFKKQQRLLLMLLGPLGFITWLLSLAWTGCVIVLAVIFNKSAFVASESEVDFPNHHKNPLY